MLKWPFLSLILLAFLFSCNSEEEASPQIEAEDLMVSVLENPANGFLLGTIKTNSSSTEVSFALVSQDPRDAMSLSSAGELTVADSSLFDFELHRVIQGKAIATSGNDTDSLEIIITINDIAEDPESDLEVSNFNLTIAENLTQSQPLGTILVSGGGRLAFELTQQTPAGALSVDSLGNLFVADVLAFDFEINPIITAIAMVSDSLESLDAEINIKLGNKIEGDNLNIWSGNPITFAKENGADPGLSENQDRITESVWLTRGNEGGELYNARLESMSEQNVSPKGTEWALGTTAAVKELTFLSLRETISPRSLPGTQLVLHLIEDDIFIDVRFVSWSNGGKRGESGGFSYERSTQ